MGLCKWPDCRFIIDKHSFKNGKKSGLSEIYSASRGYIYSLVFTAKEELFVALCCIFVIMYICRDLAYTVQDVSSRGITAAVSLNSEERDRFVQWGRTVGSIVYGGLSAGIPMVLEMIANAGA